MRVACITLSAAEATASIMMEQEPQTAGEAVGSYIQKHQAGVSKDRTQCIMGSNNITANHDKMIRGREALYTHDGGFERCLMLKSKVRSHLTLATVCV